MKTQFTSSSVPFSGEITEADRARFEEKGYLAFEQILSNSEVAEATAALTELVHANAFVEGRSIYIPPFANGRAKFKSPRSPFFIEMEPGYEPSPERMEELELKVRKFMLFADEHPVFQSMVQGHPRIGKVVDALLGPGAKMFQSMALVKPPFIGIEKPWHQDNAYFSMTPLDAIVGVWIALDPATDSNGCMHVIEGGHKKGPLKHRHTFDCEVEEGRLHPEDAVPVELAPGGAMFFYGMLPHQTPPNNSPDRRRALQFHYHAAHARTNDREIYDTIFAEADGTPASCAASRPA